MLLPACHFRGRGRRPLAPFRLEEPLAVVRRSLTFVVVPRAPSNSSIPFAGSHPEPEPLACANDAVPGVDPRNQDRAYATWFRGDVRVDPERLPSCPDPAEFHRGSMLLLKVVHARKEASCTRSPGLLRDASSKDASAPTWLDCPSPDLSTERRAPRDASDRFLQPTFQRREPARRVTTGLLGGVNLRSPVGFAFHDAMPASDSWLALGAGHCPSGACGRGLYLLCSVTAWIGTAPCDAETTRTTKTAFTGLREEKPGSAIRNTFHRQGAPHGALGPTHRVSAMTRSRVALSPRRGLPRRS